MSGEYAEISENLAEGDGGGAYVVEQAGFTMSGKNAKISNNISFNGYNYIVSEIGYGGGVCVNNGQFTMSGENAVIMKNYAQGYGGGVYVTNSGQFTMTGGIIYGNDGGEFENLDRLYAMNSIYVHHGGTAVWPTGTNGYVGINSMDPLSGNIDTSVLKVTVRAVTPTP
jgi:hypothetical protein